MKGKRKSKNKLSLVYNFIISSTLSYIYKYFTPSLINYLNEMSIFVSKNRFCVLFAKNISNYFEKTNNFIIFITLYATLGLLRSNITKYLSAVATTINGNLTSRE